ncbi:MAG: hypothetical protein RBU25_13310 [Lentisphaeria bacterium]|jgi:hypothetical protein|nr:hypothetical protein [Lentisphaeria bacterium]
MTLKEVTGITFVGILVAYLTYVAIFSWEHVSHNPRMLVYFAENSLLHFSLLFFLGHLYRRG